MNKAMVQLSNREWAILKEMARSLLRNIEDTGAGYWTVGDTFVDYEIAVLKKLAPDVKGMKAALMECETVTQSQYEAMLKEFGIEGNPNELGEINSWTLLCGPKIVEG